MPAGLDHGVALVDPPRRRAVAQGRRAHAQFDRPPALGALTQAQVGNHGQPLPVRCAGARVERVGPELDDVVALPVDGEGGPGDDRPLRVQELQRDARRGLARAAHRQREGLGVAELRAVQRQAQLTLLRAPFGERGITRF